MKDNENKYFLTRVEDNVMQSRVSRAISKNFAVSSVRLLGHSERASKATELAPWICLTLSVLREYHGHFETALQSGSDNFPGKWELNKVRY